MNVEAANTAALDILRQWAHVRGFVKTQRAGLSVDVEAAGLAVDRAPWRVNVTSTGVEIANNAVTSTEWSQRIWKASPLVALAWAIVVESEAADVDRTR